MMCGSNDYLPKGNFYFVEFVLSFIFICIVHFPINAQITGDESIMEQILSNSSKERYSIWVVKEYYSENFFKDEKLEKIKPIWKNQFIAKKIENVPTYFKFYRNGNMIVLNEELQIISIFCKWVAEKNSKIIYLEVNRYDEDLSFVDMRGKNTLSFEASGEMKIICYPQRSYDEMHLFSLNKIY